MLKIYLILLFNLQLLPSSHNEEHASEQIASYSPIQDSVLKTGWYNISDFPDDDYLLMPVDKATSENENYFVIPTPLISLKNIKSIELAKNTEPALTIQFDKEGTLLWSNLTDKNVCGVFVFIVDNKLIQVFRITEKIVNGVFEINRTEYNIADLNKFKSIIEKEKNIKR